MTWRRPEIPMGADRVPGEYERRSGLPFVGASGQLLDKALKTVRVDRGQLYITNALLCTPPGATDIQKVQARGCCAERLRTELASVPAVPILALGSVAAKSLLADNNFSIMEMSGALFSHEGRHLIPTIHPAAILRGGDEGGAHAVDLLYINLLYDIDKVRGLAQGDRKPFTHDIETETESPARAEALIRSIVFEARKTRLLGIDLECDALPDRDARSPIYTIITAVGLATEMRAVSVVWKLMTPMAKRLLASVLADSTMT
jgi:DNA polymerase